MLAGDFRRAQALSVVAPGALTWRLRNPWSEEKMARARQILAHLHTSGSGKARQLCAGSSGVNFLRDLDGVVNLNAEVADRALDLRMSQQLGVITHLELTH